MRLGSALPKGHYADDDIVQHVTMHRCYIVATCDKDLKRRIRKIPGKRALLFPCTFFHLRSHARTPVSHRPARRRLCAGVPIMYIKSRKYTIERMPDVSHIAPRV